jgi:hypothetical protein
METQKQKAQELVDNYLMIVGGYWNGTAQAKKCALIDVQNSIDLLKHIDENEAYNVAYYIKELIEIKTEIEKL